MAVLNDIFAEAFDELKRNHGIKTQKELASRMGVSEDTITRIMKHRTEVTEDIITKLQTASGCIFNLQWLSGKELNMFPPERIDADNPQESASDLPTATELYDMMLKEKDERIRELQIHIDDQRIELANKERTIQSLVQQMATLNARLAAYQQSSLDNYPFHVGVSEPNSTHV